MATSLLRFALAPCLGIVAFAQGLPPWFTLPGNARAEVSVEEAHGEADFRIPKKDENLQRGRHWKADLRLEGVAEDLAGRALWNQLKPSLLKGGWTVAGEFDANPFSVTLRNQRGRDAWAFLWVISPGDIRLELVECAVLKSTFALTPPAEKPEAVSAEAGDFPYLKPLPGSTFTSSAREPRDFVVVLPGQTEAVVVAPDSIQKVYAAPERLSTLAFAQTYGDALKAAGWTVVESVHGTGVSDGMVTAHYARNGRDLWARLHLGNGDLTLAVADAGRRDLAQALRKDCRVTLDGVFFDFNKATIKPESDAALGRAAAALKASPGLAVEVQGHTDAVGGDAPNQKLSEARAQSVTAWLVAHGVPAGQLTARGYGKTRPIAPNDTDAGRARNRRVDLACRK